jgi:hypothetical protein
MGESGNKRGDEHLRQRPPAADAPMPRAEPTDALRVAGRMGPPGAGTGDEELRSAVVFGDAWNRIHGLVAARRRWRVIRAEPVEGVLEVEVQHWLGGGGRALRIALALDEVGMTRAATSWAHDAPGRPDWRLSRELTGFRGALRQALGDTPPR